MMMDTKSRPDPVAVRLDELATQVAYLVERQRKTEELFAEMTPILREVMATATTRLDDLEKRGWFAVGREAAAAGARILDHYGVDDVRALGDAVIVILDTVRALTQPSVLGVVREAAQALEHLDRAKPIGLVGAMRASRKPDVQKGLAVLMDVVGAVGRAAGARGQARADQPDKDDKHARLAAMLGPKRSRPIAALPPHGEERREATPPKAPAICATPKPAEIDPASWTREYAVEIAAAEGITLTDAHWKLIDLARAEYLEKKVAANIRRMTQLAGCSTKDIYALFPKAPGRTIARIAGTPKPAGCL
jgi:tRNA 2-thiouridine synthesizing protein E